MRLALAEAADAAKAAEGESRPAEAAPEEEGPDWPADVPVGAVILDEAGTVIARARNRREMDRDPTAHAEIVAIRDASARVGNYRLTGATLCVTIEPCLMCVGALTHGRIGTLVYGAAEPRSGAVVSAVRGGELPGHNHRFEVVSGIREVECRALMLEFFREKR